RHGVILMLQIGTPGMAPPMVVTTGRARGAGPAGGTVVHRGSTQPPGFAARGTGRLAGRSAGSTDRPCPGAVARRPGATLDHRGTGSRGRPVPLGVRRALHPPARPAAHALPVPVATATGRPPAARGAHAGEHRGGGR